MKSNKKILEEVLGVKDVGKNPKAYVTVEDAIKAMEMSNTEYLKSFLVWQQLVYTKPYDTSHLEQYDDYIFAINEDGV